MTPESGNADGDRDRQFMAALTAEHATLQSARSATIAESAARSSLYVTTLSSSVVALALVAQATQFGDGFIAFALTVLPVVFFLGAVTYARLLQTGIEDVVYARSISRIRRFYAQIDPKNADYFRETSLDQVGLRSVGLFTVRWQQFLASAATVAIVNAVVGGVVVALLIGEAFRPALTVSAALGTIVAAVLGAVFFAHHRRALRRAGDMQPTNGGTPDR